MSLPPSFLGVPLGGVKGPDGSVDATSLRAAAVTALARRPAWMPMVCAVAWTWLLWDLVLADGGRWPGDQPRLLLVAAVVAVAAQHALVTRGRFLPVLVMAVVYGAIASLLLAGIRAGWVDVFVPLAIALAAGIGAIRLWREPWGPRFVGVVVTLAAMVAWYQGFLAWWGGALERQRWLALSFENQSGPLMAAVAMVGLGLAIGHQRRLRIVGLLVAGAGLSGSWLSGSRGTVVLLVPVLALVITLGIRLHGVRRTLAGFGAAASIAVALVAALTWTATPPGEDAGVERLIVNPSTDTRNLQARFGYWPPTLDMFREAPIVGTGPGSFRWASRPYWLDTVELSATPHNVYLRALSERGIVGGLPIWIGAGAIGWLVWLALRRARREPPGVGPAARLASVGAVAILGSHAGMDFDWDYPLLFAALTIAAGILLVEVGRHEPAPLQAPQGPRRRSREAYLADAATLGVVAVVVLSFAGVSAQQGREPAPWDLEAALGTAVTASATDEIGQARSALARIARWNEASWQLPPIAAVVDHADGLITDQQLAAAVGPRSTAIQDQLLVADRLLESGSPHLAGEIIDGLRPVVDARRAWFFSQDLAAELTLRTLEIEAAIGGCEAVRRVWDTEQAWLGSFDVEVAVVAQAWDDRSATDCPL